MTLPLRIELAMTFKAVFPDVLSRDRSGHGHPGASEAVSGCNILILPLHASVLRARFGLRTPGRARRIIDRLRLLRSKGEILAMAHHLWTACSDCRGT